MPPSEPDQITVIVKRPGERAEALVTLDDADVYRTLIGGWLEPITVAGYPGYMDEEGKLKNARVNFTLGGTVVVGPVIFFGGMKEGRAVGFGSVAEANAVIALLEREGLVPPS